MNSESDSDSDSESESESEFECRLILCVSDCGTRTVRFLFFFLWSVCDSLGMFRPGMLLLY